MLDGGRSSKSKDPPFSSSSPSFSCLFIIWKRKTSFPAFQVPNDFSIWNELVQRKNILSTPICYFSLLFIYLKNMFAVNKHVTSGDESTV
uniref:Uncharacterized protein n=1 Tax=Chelonoidis abingdonii TaxID=106734 RepID=A0A8C0HDM9_CHEAB